MFFSKKWRLFSGVGAWAGARWRAHTKAFFQKLVNHLAQGEAKLSRNQKLLCLFCFVMLSTGACVYILVDAFAPSGKKVAAPVQMIRPPAIPGQREKQWLSVIDTVKIRRFKKMMDSLQTTPAGRKELETFKRSHPGLVDSFLLMEQQIR